MGKIAGAIVLGAAITCGALTVRAQTDRDYSAPGSTDHVPPEQRVDINRASLEDLLKVPRVKRTWAKRILRFRPYRTKQDLLDEGVVPSPVYARIRDYLIAQR